MKKKIFEKCEHIDSDNEQDCEQQAMYICMCCSARVCELHRERECPYGGMGYIEIDN
jgi:hypothetical protein